MLELILNFVFSLMWLFGGLLILISLCVIVLCFVKIKEECMVSIMNKDVKDCLKFGYFILFMIFKSFI